MILAIDTTTEHGSIALAHPDGTLIEENSINAPDGFGQVLFDRVKELMSRHPGPLTKIAAASGPGTFTGVRVGLAAAKGLAEALGLPAIGVSNLAAIASHGTGPLRAAYCDARRGEIYGGVYDAAGAAVTPEVVANLDAWVANLPPGAELITPHADAPMLLAAAIARIAASHPGSDPAAIDANYVRRTDAEMKWTDKSPALS